MRVALRTGVLIAMLGHAAAFGQTVGAPAPQRTDSRPILPAAAPPATNDATISASNGRLFALIVCGHPGDQEHLVQFADSVSKIRQGLATHYSVTEDRMRVLFGEGFEGLTPDPSAESAESESEDSDTQESDAEETEGNPSPGAKSPVSLPDWRVDVPAANRENLTQTIGLLKQRIMPADTLWVIVMGHSHHDRGRTWFNLAGEDIQQNQFAAMFADVQAVRQTFFVTIPASGYYVRPLSRPGRIIIAATEPGLEINETLFPHVLAETISRPPRELPDVDGDGRASLLDLYIAVTTDVAHRYADDGLLSTEHAVLDDNADRRATEIQLHFLPEDRGGLPTAKQRKSLRTGRDGAVATQVILSATVVAPPEAESE